MSHSALQAGGEGRGPLSSASSERGVEAARPVWGRVYGGSSPSALTNYSVRYGGGRKQAGWGVSPTKLPLTPLPANFIQPGRFRPSGYMEP